METIEIIPEKAQTQEPDFQQNLIEYYEIAGPDYQAWSQKFNMHFGYFKWGMNPFRLERMLDQMNFEVYKRLQVPENQPAKILDLGCGLGATARYLAKLNKCLTIKGLSIVPWQIEQARQLTKLDELSERVKFLQADYTQTGFESATYDFAYALESSCYAQGTGKADLIAEMARILRPGGRFVIADGFLKRPKPLPFWLNGIYKKVCDAWALEDFGEINEFKQNLENQGFTNIKVEEISWNIAPSVAYIPKTTLKFLLQEIWQTGSLRLAPHRQNNVIAPILGMILGLARPYFGYYLVSGEKS
jgi:ubiquinone/menaquinone biosynthesis C-methylase UbiE